MTELARARSNSVQRLRLRLRGKSADTGRGSPPDKLSSQKDPKPRTATSSRRARPQAGEGCTRDLSSTLR